METSPRIGLDVETAGLEAAWTTDCEFFCAHLYSDTVDEHYTDVDELRTRVQELLQDGYTFVCHNASFDISVLRLLGVNIPCGNYDDTMGMAYCMEPDSRKSLSDLSIRYLGESKLESPEFTHYSEEMAEYNRQDTRLTFKLDKILRRELRSDPTAWHFWYDIELPYIERIIEMQQVGSPIDREAFLVAEKDVKATVREKNRACRRLVDSGPRTLGTRSLGVNLRSPTQLTKEFIRQGWKPKKFTRSGKPVLDKYELANLQYKFPLAEALLDYRKWVHVESNFIQTVHTVTQDFKYDLHTSLNQFHVRTGRLSSSKP